MAEKQSFLVKNLPGLPLDVVNPILHAGFVQLFFA